jgi:hypothetical protein
VKHPATQLEILEALESNARSIVEFFSGLPERHFFDGDPEHWGPAHHLRHLTEASISVERALRSKTLPLHPAGLSRTYPEVRDAATASLEATPKDRLLEMGRTVVIPAGSRQRDVVEAFMAASAALRDAATTWTEHAMDRHALPHPLMGRLTVREMLLFFVVHERHHLKIVRTRLEARS